MDIKVAVNPVAIRIPAHPLTEQQLDDLLAALDQRSKTRLFKRLASEQGRKAVTNRRWRKTSKAERSAFAQRLNDLRWGKWKGRRKLPV